MKVLISGGGTGGHVFPAIAIADALRAMAPDTGILFAGAKGKLEMDRVPKAGYPIEGLWISGFHRSWRWENLLFPLKLGASLWKAEGILRKFKPDVVVGVGGYASGPVLYRAASKGIPTLIQEQNSFPGITNRLLAKKVHRICVAYPGMERFFPKEKLLLTGNPVRKLISDAPVSIAEARQRFGLQPDLPTVFIVGGSLGARSFNRAMALQTGLLEKNRNLQVLWQTGKLYWEEYRKDPLARHPRVKILPFVERMDLAYAAADVVVSRAGALSVSELAVAGKAVVFIPSPNVAEDHQTKNAQALVDEKAALLVSDEEANEKILRTPLKLIADEAARKKLEQNIKRLAKPRAAEEIAKAILSLP